MATYSSILAWEIPWTEEPGGLQSTGSQRVGHDLATKTTMMFSVLEQKTSLLSSSVKLQQIFKIYTSFSGQNLFYKTTSLSYFSPAK